MKVEVLREKLNQAISIVGRAAVKSINLPVLEGVMVKAEDNAVRFSATDLEIGIEVSALAKVSKEGQAVVPARILGSLGKLMSDDKIILEMSKKSLFLKDSENESSLQTMNADDFPVIPQPDNGLSVQVDGAALSDGLKQVVGCASTSQSRPEISGIYFRFKDDQLTLAATDSYRLAQKTVTLAGSVKKEKELILPAKTANNLIGVLGESAGPVDVFGDDNQIQFSASLGEPPLDLKVKMVSRLIEGTYPRYEEVIPQKAPIRIRVDRHEFLSKIKAASLLSDQTYEVKLMVSAKEGRLKIEARSSRVGEFKSSLPAEIEGGDLEVSFNGRFLSDVLFNIESPDVWLQLTDADKAALINSDQDQSYLYVLMPIRSS